MIPRYSVVIPIKNEAENLPDLIQELEPIMQNLQCPWELICIDDGSTDGTEQLLCHLTKQKPYLRVISFKKNYGQSSAFAAGFKAAQGEFVITMDGDGQNDPADICRLLPLMQECDLVCGIRHQRKDSLNKRLISKMANSIRQWLCQDGVADTGCSLKIYRKACLNQIKMFHGMHRFLPALFKIEGFRIKQLPVNHRQRLRGKSHYHFFNRSLNTLADLLAVYWMHRRHLCYQIKEDDL